MLSLLALDDCLDDKLPIRHEIQVATEAQPGHSSVTILGLQFASLDGFAERLLNASLAGRSKLSIGFMDDDVDARLGSHLGDPCTHLATTNDPDPFDAHGAPLVLDVAGRILDRGQCLSSILDDFVCDLVEAVHQPQVCRFAGTVVGLGHALDTALLLELLDLLVVVARFETMLRSGTRRCDSDMRALTSTEGLTLTPLLISNSALVLDVCPM